MHIKIVYTSIYQLFHVWIAVMVMMQFIKLRWELQAFFPKNNFQADVLLQETCVTSFFAIL